MPRPTKLDLLLEEVRSCKVCEPELPLGANPILRAKNTSKILIVGQAPGTKVHRTGIPWNDPSGDRLREWMRLDQKTFYDERKIAIVPMGFCYPGKGKGGDLPPRRECGELWHQKILKLLPSLELVLLVGNYAQSYYLAKKKKSLTETVRAWQDYFPKYLPLPHPSPRNLMWFRRNDWFEKDVIPELRKAVSEILNNGFEQNDRMNEWEVKHAMSKM